MTDAIKYCADCVFCLPSKDHEGVKSFEYSHCVRPIESLPKEAYVHPDLANAGRNYCSTERIVQHLCTPNAIFFQPKVSA